MWAHSREEKGEEREEMEMLQIVLLLPLIMFSLKPRFAAVFCSAHEENAK